MTNKKEYLIYTAGIIDGEGCIKIYRVSADYLRKYKNARRNFDRFTLIVQVDMTYRPIVKWLHKKFGGSLYEHKRNKEKHPNWQDSLRWYIASQQAGKFLRKIYPYLQVKRKQAKDAIKFIELTPKHKKKQYYWLRLKQFNGRGKKAFKVYNYLEKG
jgi:hypothetical protein